MSVYSAESVMAIAIAEADKVYTGDIFRRG